MSSSSSIKVTSTKIQDQRKVTNIFFLQEVKLTMLKNESINRLVTSIRVYVICLRMKIFREKNMNLSFIFIFFGLPHIDS